jgi:hypothetical protein
LRSRIANITSATGDIVDVVYWHICDMPRYPTGVRNALKSRHRRGQRTDRFKDVKSNLLYPGMAKRTATKTAPARGATEAVLALQRHAAAGRTPSVPMRRLGSVRLATEEV